MLFYDILFQIGNIKVLPDIFQCCFCVGESVEPLALFRLVCMPVIEEQVVEKSGSCACALVQREKPAHFIIVVGNIQTVLEAACFTMVRKFFHFKYQVMLKKVGDEVIVDCIFLAVKVDF